MDRLHGTCGEWDPGDPQCRDLVSKLCRLQLELCRSAVPLEPLLGQRGPLLLLPGGLSEPVPRHSTPHWSGLARDNPDRWIPGIPEPGVRGQLGTHVRLQQLYREYDRLRL